MTTPSASNMQPQSPSTTQPARPGIHERDALDADVAACLQDFAQARGRPPVQADLLPLLLAVQARAGRLQDVQLRNLAQALNISRAEVHGVASFYPDLQHAADAVLGAPPLELCAAEACQARGANELLRLTAGDARVRSVYCLGNCASGPSARLGDQVFANLTRARLEELLQGITAQRQHAAGADAGTAGASA